MLRAGHRLQERIYQTADIVFCGNANKRVKLMAAALGTDSGGLNDIIRDATQSPEWTAEIDRFLAAMLTEYALGESLSQRARDIHCLADQYLSLHRERPLLIPGAVQGDPIFEEITDIPEVDTIDLSWMPPELQALAAEMLADED